MPIGIQWTVLNKCTMKFHQLERVKDSRTCAAQFKSVDKWTALVMVACFIRLVSFYCVDIIVNMYLFEPTWMFLWIVN